MGGTSSKTTVNDLIQSINNITMQTIQQCVTNSAQSQSVTENNTGIVLFSNSTAQQSTTISVDCFANAQLQAQLQNNIISTISNASTATNSTLLGAFGNTSSEATTNLTSLIKNNVTMKNIQQNYNTIMQQQNVNYNNSGLVVYQNVDLKQGAQVFSAATLQAIDSAGIFNQINNYVNQQSAATSTGFSLSGLFSGLFSGASSIFVYIFVFIIIVALGGWAYEKWSSGRPVSKIAY